MRKQVESASDASQPCECQLQTVYREGCYLRLTDRIRLSVLRVLGALERRIANLRRRIALAWVPSETPGQNPRTKAVEHRSCDLRSARHEPFKPGELVEVLPYDEIAETLDDRGCCDRMQFLDGMRQYCGRQFIVRRRVRAMFDERKWRMVRLKNTYILDGAVCDGMDQFDKEGCDRCCFYFWRGQWLQRVGDASGKHAERCPADVLQHPAQ